MFLYDIYHDKKIIKDNIIPEDFVYMSTGYLPQCEGVNPPKNIYTHIAGIDLVQGRTANGIFLRIISEFLPGHLILLLQESLLE